MLLGVLQMARCTQAVKLQFMALSHEPLFLSHGVRKCFDALIFEFNNRGASGADHVVVTSARFLVFKAGEAILTASFLDEVSFSQQL